MSEKTFYDKLVDWFDVKLGFAKAPLKPIPDFALNPIYWLGLLLAVTFGLQALTGIFMLLYYVPTPAEAYTSTMFVINSVPLGKLTETFHLYTAYAMILLTFLHLLRNFFGSAHKGNRDLMWLAGIVLGILVVSFGVTGYLLPWTVISKSASDVAIGFINFLPTPLANLGKFVAVGSGSDASHITTFLHVHTVFLPLALIALLGLKIYMYEVHGPAYVSAYGKPKTGKYLRWFPKIFLYAVILFSAYIAILLALSSIFPLELPPAYSPATAGQYVVQPDWYLLWVYQLLKIQAFEGPEAVYATVGIAVFAVLLLLLPFYDRSKRRDLGQRPLYATIGTILVMEFITLTIWGYMTPGQVIPNEQAAALLFGVAIETAVVVWIAYAVRRRKCVETKPGEPSLATPATGPAVQDSAPSAAVKVSASSTKRLQSVPKQISSSMLSRFTVVFVAFLAVASVSLASLVNMLPQALAATPFFVLAASAFAVSMYFMCRMLRNYVLVYEQKVAT
jgi:ubiquinol-cytochrome c reductase cytochrome b subunit